MFLLGHVLFLLLLSTLCRPFPDYTWMKINDNSLNHPEFEDTPLSVTVEEGQTAVLPCSVKNIADKLVSWIRRKDLSILSSGSLVFTSDSRFRLYRSEDGSSWSLHLHKSKSSDEGLYECQVNTEPKMKRGVLLTVIDKFPALELSYRDDSSAYGESHASILGPKERLVREGGTISLTCHVSATSTTKIQRPPRLVDWMFQDIPITSQVAGVSVDTERSGSEISSKLTLNSATLQDSGVYTCSSQYAAPTSVIVVVIDEDRSEAMIGEPSGSRSSHTNIFSYLTLTFVIMVSFYL